MPSSQRAPEGHARTRSALTERATRFVVSVYRRRRRRQNSNAREESAHEVGSAAGLYREGSVHESVVMLEMRARARAANAAKPRQQYRPTTFDGLVEETHMFPDTRGKKGWWCRCCRGVHAYHAFKRVHHETVQEACRYNRCMARRAKR